ncbi:MAG: zf-TFIIB domain-containing protein [Anaerolineae bacterium]|nr:zf-TFIIB domain-containing protein [Anaerolineae bacterium]
MECPKCHAPMEKVTYQNIEVDRCTSCHGLWFDRFEKEQLKKLEGSEIIDVGEPQPDVRPDSDAPLRCSVCQVKMTRMVDAKQPHIWYESCPSCNGVFLDAGEFRDYKQENWMDMIMDLFTRERQ